MHESSTNANNIFRWYRPGAGRYTQADPIGLKGGLNLYGYAYDNPVVAYDRYGLAVWFCNRKTSWGSGNHGYLWDDRDRGRGKWQTESGRTG